MIHLKTELKWAVIFSLMTLLWMLLEKLSGLHGKYIDYQAYLTNLYAIPAIVIMTLALREKKMIFFGGKISYKQGLISGTILSVFIALLSPLTQCITTYIISPDYFPNVIKRSVELGYYKTVAEASANFNYQSFAIQGFVGSLIMGIITSAIVMIFLRTKKQNE